MVDLRTGLNFPPTCSGELTARVHFFPVGSSMGQKVTEKGKQFGAGTRLVEVAWGNTAARQLVCTIEIGTDVLWFAWVDEGISWRRFRPSTHPR